MKTFLLLCLLANSLFITTAWAASDKFNYHLKPVEIAKDTWLFEGRTQDFSRKNGGNIVNSAFIITEEGVIVIDTGPSRRFAEQQRAAISAITDKPILRVYITHHHPDHFLGNQVYKDIPIYALKATTQGINAEGETFNDNMYRLVGDWMRGTKVTPPTQKAEPGKLTLGGHELELIAMHGHTAGDLVIFDHSTGVLFTGDLVFNQRAATTPHATVSQWQESLKQLATLPFKLLVPGHGSASKDSKPIDQTRDYLNWLVATLKQGAEDGLDMIEVMQSPIPARFESISLTQEELTRSVNHLFPAIEDTVLETISQPE